MDIIVLGSINMDLVVNTKVFPESGETVLGDDFLVGPGGKGANQATAIGKLGIKPEFIGCVGNDLYGKESLENMNINKINTDFVKTVVKSTGIATIILYEDNNRIIVVPGANAKVEMEQVEACFKTKTKDSIFLTQFENNLDVVFKSLQLAKTKGMYTILNPAPYIDVDKSIYNDLDLLVLNESECSSLVNFPITDRESITKAVNIISKLGVKNLVITIGEAGSYLYENNNLNLIPAFKADVVDTTCAGDSYIGALTYAVSQGKTLLDACYFAAKIASITVSRKGAQNSIPTMEEFMKHQFM